MRPITRALSSAVAATVATVVVAAAPASAATGGVGSSTTKTAVLSLQLGKAGSLLNLGLLTDTGGANIDNHGGAPGAAASLVPITLASPMLHLDLSTPPVSTLSPGGASDSQSTPLTLQSLGVPASVATASIKPAILHSDYASTAAHSAMSAAEIDNVTLVGGGLASINLLSSTLGADAVSSQADSQRGVNVGVVKLLDLGALLKGLGMDVSALPVSTLSALLQSTGLPVPGLKTGTTLADDVAGLNASLTSLRSTLVGATTQITTPVDSTTQGILGSLGLPIPTTGSAVTQVNTVIADVQNTLAGLLSSALSALDVFPLVQISGTSVSINTLAADTLAHSAAGVTIAPLKIVVAGQQLPPIDLSALASTVNSAVASANSALNGLLTTLGLPSNLVSLSLFDQASSVAKSGNYTTAAAGITVLTAKIAAIDPTVISGALTKLGGPSVGSLLGGASPAVLGASTAMGALSSALGVAAPLLGGAQLQIASLAGASTYALLPAATTTQNPVLTLPTGGLPHTGGNPELAIIGAVLAALALGAVRWSRMSRSAMTQPVRIQD